MSWWVLGRREGIATGVAASLLVIAFLDHAFGSQLPISHLYYLPILVAAVAFGYAGGLAAAGAAVILFTVIHLSLTGEVAGPAEADVLRLAGFILVGMVTARLVADRARLNLLSAELAARNAELARLNERLQELSDARADFVALASHELRTPLTVILGSAESLANVLPDGQPSWRLASHVVSAARQLQRTVENLLDATLIETGRFTLRWECVEVAELFETCRHWFVTDRLTVRLPDVNLTFRGDRDKLVQVLTNLVGNALKYSPETSRVTLDSDAVGDTIRIRVSDQGYGIAADDLPRVFERYYRADDGRVRARRGAGLGLSISRDIARAHGGDLTVRSEPGRGSTFTVILPARPASPFRESSGRPQPILSEMAETTREG